MKQYIDLTGQKFGKLLVMCRAPIVRKGTNSQAHWKCKCDCGDTVVRPSQALRTRHSVSCNSCGSPRPLSRVIGVATNALYSSYRHDANRRNKEFALSPSEFRELILKPCAYCGSEPSQIIKFPHEILKHGGIDRLDNSKGYHKENCQPCCKVCNIAKRAMAEEEFLLWAKRLYEFRGLNNYGGNIS